MSDAFGSILSSSRFAAFSNSTGFDSFAINSANDRVAWVCSIPDDDVITGMGWRHAGRTGTPVQHRGGLQGIDGSGFPDGTFLGGGSPASQTFTPPADATWNNTWPTITFANSYALGGGVPVAIVIEPVGTPDGSNFSSFTTRNAHFPNPGFPYPLSQTDGAWADVTNGPAFALYSATKCYGFPVLTIYATALGTNGHRQAGRFTIPATWMSTATITGLRFSPQAISSGGSIKVALWEGTTERASATIDTDLASNAGATAYREHYFTAPYTISAGTEYRLGLERVDVSCGVDGITVHSATEAAALPGGADWMKGSTWDGSSWTNTDTLRFWVEPIFSDFTAPAGGGGGLAGILVLGNNR